jgi:hypothetical protein
MSIDGHALGFEPKPPCARAQRGVHIVAWVGCVGPLFLTDTLCNRG